ncbi:3-oxoacyl-[acyl-carrier protein] reductase [Pullulanibacillus pueri]|uniref:Putative oxidoreductase YmfI n=1 Tax=Pullulanibacillus pueri TaxID=1437324 RepID=A0A8J3EM68_9BACL|nr:SDR family NAD(P)-dependent oxidoreductase [Pullulanibacillus pueri]MBM7682538.1 3-oxoacyl-[acyl-carrier protein] reductase [Pullulanibacillus pueri]GGH82001.1 putative oxidoreductase YmfI [Pullulanibacillus pueri]
MEETKFALITGASGGIGQEIARALAEAGFSLYLHYNRNREAAEALATGLKEDYPQQSFPLIQADLTQPEGLQALQTIKVPIECLIQNSGQSHVGLITDVSPASLDAFIRANITHPFLVTQHFVPQMVKAKKGTIIFITSIWGLTGAAMEVMYSMVKGAQNSFVKALAKELAPSHINVNAVAPGAIETAMMATYDEETMALLRDEIPAGRLGTANEVAALVKFLASPSAEYINGQIISINGAWYC